MRCALLDFYGDVGVVLEILGKPYGGEMTPPKLLDDDISLKKNLTKRIKDENCISMDTQKETKKNTKKIK